MLNFLGLLAVMGASVAVGVCYRGYREETIKYIVALYEFFMRLLREVECYGRSVSDWAGEFTSAPLMECGFLKMVRKGERLQKAFCEARSKMQITKEVEELVTLTLDHYGTRSIETEISELKEAVRRIEEMIKTEKDAKDKSVRAVFAMSLGVAVGLCLLLS